MNSLYLRYMAVATDYFAGMRLPAYKTLLTLVKRVTNQKHIIKSPVVLLKHPDVLYCVL